MRVSKLLKPEACMLLSSTTKNEALMELVESVDMRRHSIGRDEILQRLLAREELMSTGIGLGLGIPHIRAAGIGEPVLRLGVSPGGDRRLRSHRRSSGASAVFDHAQRGSAAGACASVVGDCLPDEGRETAHDSDQFTVRRFGLYESWRDAQRGRIMHILELINGRMQVEELNALLFIGIALFGGTIGGRFFQRIKVPQVVGYILIGLILGESGIRLITLPTLLRFEPINYFALGLISFSLGGELKLDMLKRSGKQFTLISAPRGFRSLSDGGASLVPSSSPCSPDRSGGGGQSASGQYSGCHRGGRNHRCIVRVPHEGGRHHDLLGIIALDDILALFLFTLTASLVSPFLGFSGANPVVSLLQPLYETVGSVGLGLAAGYVLIALLKRYSEEERIFVFSMGAILLVLGQFDLSGSRHADDRDDHGCGIRQQGALVKARLSLGLIEKFSTPIYVLLFVFVGAKLRFQSLSAGILLIVAVFIIARFTGKLVGARLGARLSRAPEKLRRYLPFCLLSQSGVAIGLSIIAAQRFPGLGGRDHPAGSDYLDLHCADHRSGGPEDRAGKGGRDGEEYQRGEPQGTLLPGTAADRRGGFPA